MWSSRCRSPQLPQQNRRRRHTRVVRRPLTSRSRIRFALLSHTFGQRNPQSQNVEVYGYAEVRGNTFACCGISGDWFQTDKIRIYGTAKVYNAFIRGAAKIYGNADVGLITQPRGRPEVAGNAKVYGYADIYGNAKVFGNAEVYGHADIFGSAEVSGRARVDGTAMVSGDARVFGNAEISGTAKITGNAIFGDGMKASSGTYDGEKQAEQAAKELVDEAVKHFSDEVLSKCSIKRDWSTLARSILLSSDTSEFDRLVNEYVLSNCTAWLEAKSRISRIVPSTGAYLLQWVLPIVGLLKLSPIVQAMVHLAEDGPSLKSLLESGGELGLLGAEFEKLKGSR